MAVEYNAYVPSPEEMQRRALRADGNFIGTGMLFLVALSQFLYTIVVLGLVFFHVIPYAYVGLNDLGLGNTSYLLLYMGVYIVMMGAPLPVAALAILVATMERELPGVLFCIFCGYLCDLYSVAPMGFYMLFLTILGLAAGLIIRNYLQSSLPIIMAAVLIAAFFCRLVLFLFRYPLAGVTGAAPVLLRYDLPHAVYSAVLAVPLYYPVRALHRMAEERTDTRL